MEAAYEVHEDHILMPAGHYYVGDPCYGVPDERWQEWLDSAREQIGGSDWPRYLVATVDGLPVLGIGTAYGDGTYEGSDGRMYPVDAGLIGMVPVEVAEEPVGESPFGMVLHYFPEDVHCTYDQLYGTISLGGLDVQTDPPDDDPYLGEQPDEGYYPEGEDL